jgi:polyisoprenoid-binding protein YceI
MGCDQQMKNLTRFAVLTAAILGVMGITLAQVHPHKIDLKFVPAKTMVNFTLGDILHTVPGVFDVKQGVVHFDPTTNKISGEILVDATSGHSGNDGRDKKMHKEVLESASYPDIVFRPDRVEGEVSDMAASTVQVHGMFSIHGAEHEITIPVRVKVSPGQWTATSHFTVPYVKWGLKNPSTFVLRVGQSVEIDIQVSGETP